MMSNQKYRRTNFEEDHSVSPASQWSPDFQQVAGAEPPENGNVHPGVTYNSSTHCWGRRTRFEKVLMILLGVCIFLIFLLAMVDVSHSLNKTEEQQESSASRPHCHSLDGAWYNQLGSEILLKHTPGGRLGGEYRTAVERQNSSAGSTHSKIVGTAPYKTSSVFAFAVLWNSGESTTAWTGQCVSCDGEEVLLTSWLLRSQVDTCRDKWRSTLIGQDVFTRREQAPGPRRKYDTNVPSEKINKSLQRTERTADIYNTGCRLEGTWYNELGSEMILRHQPGVGVSGEYRTAVELSRGSAGSSHSEVAGLSELGDANSTLALFVVWREGESVTGWVGQCHLCGENGTEQVETTWLLRSRVDSCDDNWRSTLHGQSSFSRAPPTPGPRRALGIHTPGQTGEDAAGRAAALLGRPELLGTLLLFVLLASPITSS